MLAPCCCLQQHHGAFARGSLIAHVPFLQRVYRHRAAPTGSLAEGTALGCIAVAAPTLRELVLLRVLVDRAGAQEHVVGDLPHLQARAAEAIKRSSCLQSANIMPQGELQHVLPSLPNLQVRLTKRPFCK